MPKIIQFLGYNPYYFETETFGGRVYYYRLLNGLSRKSMGKVVDVNASTISSWEESEFLPNGENLEIVNRLLQTLPSEADLGSAEAQPGKE